MRTKKNTAPKSDDLLLPAPCAPAQAAPKVLFLIDEMASITDGGTERQLLQLVDIAIKSGLLPHICTLRGTRWLTPQIAGCPVRHLNLASIRSAGGLRAMYRLARWIRRERFDMLQAFFPEANLIAPWVGRFAGVAVVLGSRRNMNGSSAAEPQNVDARLQRLSNLLVDQVIANSQAVLDRVVATERLPLRKGCVIYNGIDAQQLRPHHGMRRQMRAKLGIRDNELLVGNISGLRKIKGVECFIQAAALARRTHPNLRFVVVGDGDLRQDIEHLISKHGLENSILLAGAVEDVRPYLAAMDIAVLCSLAEGFSNSLLEYMVAGLPIIATDVGGNREALGAAGILIPAGDAQHLAASIGSLLEVGARDRYAAAALKAVKRFDLAIAEQRVADLFWGHLENKTNAKRPSVGWSMQKTLPLFNDPAVCRCPAKQSCHLVRQTTCIAHK